MAQVDEPFNQNDENAKRFKGGIKRKQPGTNNGSLISPSPLSTPSPTQLPAQPYINTQSPSSPVQPNSINYTPGQQSNGQYNNTNNNTNNTNTRSRTNGMVYQQPKSIQHHPLQLDSSTLHLYRSNSVTSTNSTLDGRNGSFSSESRLADLNGSTSGRRHNRSDSSASDTRASSFLDFPAALPKAVKVVDHSRDLDVVTALLAETTLSNVEYYGPSAAMVANAFNDEDLWGPQLGAASTDSDVTVPLEMQILPDVSIRNHLTTLYYKNHYNSLPMVQREVLRVCQENIHIPHCLLLCNAVYYCGSMFSTNATLRKDMNDESTVGEDFFIRGQTLLEKKYLTTHLCTIQALLLFAIGHKSPAQRSGFISQAITMALDMGLHTRLDDSVSPFVRAYRARVFWCCYMFDSTVSAINGKPTLINDEEIGIDMFQAGDLGPEPDTFSDQYVIHCLNGWQICRRIRKNTKLISRQPPPPRAILMENLSRLDNELVEWQHNLPKPFEFLPVDGCIVSDISSLSACAQLLCYALIILLHYPYLPNPKSPEAFKPPPPGVPDSQGYCTQAAKEITKIGGILLNEAPRTFEQNTPSRYALNFAVRIHLRNAKCLVDSTLARESRRDLQKTMDYIEHIENLQFFRINRGKKSDVADLLASCRAALAQHKSSLDMAREAAAAKHQQMLKQKEAMKQKKLQEQQLQQQQQQLQHIKVEQLPQPVLASQPVMIHNQFQPQDSIPEGSLTPSQVVLTMQASQQHNLQQQSYKQHMLHVQMYTQEHNQQEMARLNHLHRQGQLDEAQKHQEYYQQRALAKQRQQIFMQQQHPPQPHAAFRQQQRLQQQHQQQQMNAQQMLQNSTLFQGQNLGFPMTMMDNAGNMLNNGNANGNGSTFQFALLDVQDPSAFTNLSSEQQQQLFVASSQCLSGTSNLYNPNNQSFPQGSIEALTEGGRQNSIQGQENAVFDLGNMMLNPRQQQMFSSAAAPSSGVNHDGMKSMLSVSSPPSHMLTGMNGMVGGVFVNGTSGSMPSHHPSMSHQSYSPMLSPPLPIQGQSQQQLQQQRHFQQLQKHNNQDIVNGNGGRYGSPDSAPSPGESISEESILQSWCIPTFQDNVYMNPNLSKDDPRNDLGTFQYLPSEFEYGDAPALSPAASSVSGGNGGNGVNGGSDGGNSPPRN
ncbi:hypothetical protein BGZ46_002610 [Entomortierella lignicola]|nr:hypothetical protein BGZ46_002610 [Entomortierella lignicola]